MVTRDDYIRKRSSSSFAERARKQWQSSIAVQRASADAFVELMRGADRALQGMGEAFERARKSFERK